MYKVTYTYMDTRYEAIVNASTPEEAKEMFESHRKIKALGIRMKICKIEECEDIIFI